jgi:uncharacterized protein YdeI (YjbR/CyaY-like superfamily)
MAKTTPDQYEQYYARNRQEWHRWLEKNHASSSGIWLIYYKKGTEEPCVTYEEAVEEALSFGWIDSKVNALDEKRYMQVFTPRKSGSNWSRSNKERIERLVKSGKMTHAGLEKVDAAKKDGSWNVLDDVEDLKIPEDLITALEANKTALKYFRAFTDSSKKQILWWIVSAKRQDTRMRRIKKAVALAEKNKKP